MRVPSFFTKSASSTPATWVLVVVYAVGGADLLARRRCRRGRFRGGAVKSPPRP